MLGDTYFLRFAQTQQIFETQEKVQVSEDLGILYIIYIYPGSPRPNKVAGLLDDPCKGFPTTNGQSLVQLDFLGYMYMYVSMQCTWLHGQLHIFMHTVCCVSKLGTLTIP